MKSILGIVSVVLGAVVFSIQAADQPAEKLKAIQADLKPLRVQAYGEPDVKAAKEKLDAAYREYWDAVRTAMIRLDPSKKAQIEEEVKLRKELNPIRKSSKAKIAPADSKPTKS